jgi:hypothetical protein
MATTIKLKNGSGAPLAGDLVQGEPAFDLTNKRLYTEDSGGTVIEVGTNPSTLTVDTDTLAVDATNNRVGIGTTSPTSTASAGPTLEISGTAGGNLVLSDSNATSGQRAKYLLSQGGALYVGHSADNGTSPVNDLVINASGNVGIGTSSPSFILGTGLHIDSSGYTSIVLQKGGAGQGHNIDFTDASNALQYRIGTNFASGGENLLFAYGSTPTIGMTLNASGNVGIGTTSPNGKLDITGSGNTDIYLNTGNNSGDNNRLFFGDTADIDVGYLSYDHGTNTMSFGVNAAERMRIDSSGNVLIGNTAQIGTEKLSVNINSGGTAYNTSSMQSSALAWLNNAENDLTKASTLVLRQFNAASAISGLYTGTQNAALTFGTSSSGSSGNVVESMRIDSSGNVGIGTASPVVSSGYNSLTINDTTSGYLVLQNNGTTKMEAYVSGGTEATLRGTGVPLAFVTTAAHEMTFDTNATERMRIDSSGNVGIGVAPVAGYGKKLQVHSAAGGGASVHITDSVTGSTASDGLELITFNSAAYIWNREASFMSFGTSATEHMRLDSSGNVGIGTTSPIRNLQIGDHSGAQQALSIQASTTGKSDIFLGDGTGSGEYAGLVRYDHASDFMAFWTASSESMRIDSSGNVLVGATSQIGSSRFSAKATSNNTPISGQNNATVTTVALFNLYSNVGSTGALKFQIQADGDAFNTNNSYGSLSDERLKSNIINASSQIDDIMAVQVRSYTLNETGDTHIGVVAQELEASGMSGLVQENEDGMKSVKYSVLYMKAIKALQEAVTRIETLEAEVAALKGE